MKVRFCRMTKDMLCNTFRKELIPAVIEQKRIILKHSETIPVRSRGLIPFAQPLLYAAHAQNLDIQFPYLMIHPEYIPMPSPFENEILLT